MTEPSTSPAAEAPAEKVDPETLSLRAKPAPAVRFKREAIIAIAAITSIGVLGVIWAALRPADFGIADRKVNRVAVRSTEPTDILAQLPASYDKVPELGPPFPGDLGRPILRHREQAGAAAHAGNSQAMIDQAKAEQEARQAAERRAARKSTILIRSADTAKRVTAPSPGEPHGAALPNVDRIARDPLRGSNTREREANVTSAAGPTGVNPHRLQPAASPYTLSAGSVISASLITGIRSDLPGPVVAQVTERVYDSVTGDILLIPQGARLLGTYDSAAGFGQSRVLVVWQRLILPDGSSLRIGNVPAADPAGYSGLADQVDFHTWSLIEGAAISTLLGVGSNLTFSGESDLVQAIRESTQQNASRAGDQLVSRNLEIQPTITIRPGALVRLVVQRDLILQPWQETGGP